MVKVDMKRRDEWVVDLDISIDREKIEEEFDAVYKELNRTIKLPGFRQGKIPRSIIEKRMGQDLQRRAIERLVPKAYKEAVAQAKIVPITPPKIDNIDYKKDDYLRFRAQVEVRPEIALGDYKGIPLEKRVKVVTEQDIERQLESLAQRCTELVGIDDRPTKQGDIVTIDYVGSVEGVPIPGASGENTSIEIGKTRLLPGVEDELIGMQINTSKEIELNLPDDYPAKEFAGHSAVFKINLKSIKEKRLPQIDDEFAKDVGKADLNELKEAIKGDLENLNEQEARMELKNIIIKTLISRSDFSVPKGALEAEIDQMVNEFGKNLAPIGSNIEKYLKDKKITIESLRGDFRPKAIENLKGSFILDSIANKEGIEISEEEIQEEVERLAKSLSKTSEQMHKILVEKGGMGDVRQRIRMTKTLDFLLEQSNIKEIHE